MKYTVITTFNESGHKQYGQRMIDTFESKWPSEVDLMVCTENCEPNATRSNTHIRDLLHLSGELNDFISRHKHNPLAHGRAGPPEVFDPKKTFRWDAQRFAFKVYSLALCEKEISGWMIWLDADTHTHTSVPLSWLATVCPQDAMISYLGRGEQYHSECGWVAYNLDHPQTRNFIKQFVDMYNNDTIFKQKEWHDSYIWDIVRRQFQGSNRFVNLNHNWQDKGLSGHPFINSDLGLYMDHAKGQRKTQGSSLAKDIKQHQDHPYWAQIRTGKQ